MKKTKIVCTMGPNTDSKEMMKSLIESGMDVARFNFSHGDQAEQAARVRILKESRKELKVPVAMLLDTKGPEIRTGLLRDGRKVMLKENEQFVITTEERLGDETGCSVTYRELPQDVVPGNTILIDDGLIELTVEEIKGNDIVCRIVNGGELGQKKGVNIPNVKVNLPAITEKDKQDILFGIEQGFDYIAASFVRNADAVRQIRQILREHDSSMDIIAKIENAEGVENIDEIIQEADGIMVARGDLGVEIPAYEVPYIQKQIIEKCNHAYKPVITATQMLDSMIRNPRPTRAEVTDVANAIYDGTDAVMLSGETAMGKYPVEAVRMMVQIAESTEKHLKFEEYRDHAVLKGKLNVSSSMGFAVVNIANNINAACIVTPTVGGRTARLISNLRPSVPIYAVTPNEWVQRKMQLYWGVVPLSGYEEDTTENIISHALYMVTREKVVKPGDMMVFTAGDPATNVVKGEGAMTNILQVIQAR